MVPSPNPRTDTNATANLQDAAYFATLEAEPNNSFAQATLVSAGPGQCVGRISPGAAHGPLPNYYHIVLPAGIDRYGGPGAAGVRRHASTCTSTTRWAGSSPRAALSLRPETRAWGRLLRHGAEQAHGSSASDCTPTIWSGRPGLSEKASFGRPFQVYGWKHGPFRAARATSTRAGGLG